MDQKVQSEAPTGGATGRGFYKPCAFNSEGVSRETCQSLTKVVMRNRQGCCGNTRFKPCHSPWRLCVVCVSHGGIPKPVADFESGLCTFHKEHGTDGKISKPVSAESDQADPLEKEVVPSEDDELSSAEGLVILERVRLAMSKAIYISVPPAAIRSMSGQPRVYFNPERMESLADSIESSGQWMPGIIRPVTPDAEGHTYELLDGERRLRAILSRKVPQYRAMLVDIDDEAAPFVVSVIANFNRETHTTLELVDSIVKMREKLHLRMREIGKIVGIHPVKVTTYYGLRRLVPQVRDMLDPAVTQGRLLPLGAAVEISKLVPVEQTGLAIRVMTREIGSHTLRAEVVRIAEKSGAPVKKRYIDPGDHRKAVERKVELLSRAAQDLESLLANKEVRRAIHEWSVGRLVGLRATIKTSQNEVSTCWNAMNNAVEEKSEKK